MFKTCRHLWCCVMVSAFEQGAVRQRRVLILVPMVCRGSSLGGGGAINPADEPPWLFRPRLMSSSWTNRPGIADEREGGPIGRGGRSAHKRCRVALCWASTSASPDRAGGPSAAADRTEM